MPSLTKVAVLWDETIGRAQFDATEGAARAAGLALESLGVRRAEDLTGAFGAVARERADGLVVLTSPLLSLNRARIAELALKHRLPGITLFTNFPAFGLLMAYGPNQPDAFRRSASHYVARILKGARPIDLPVQRPEKLELVINLKTAKAFRLTIPPSVLARADEVADRGSLATRRNWPPSVGLRALNRSDCLPQEGLRRRSRRADRLAGMPLMSGFGLFRHALSRGHPAGPRRPRLVAAVAMR